MIRIMAMAILLAGCVVSVQPHKINRAQEVCKDHGGIHTLYAQHTNTSVRCMDGESFDDITKAK